MNSRIIFYPNIVIPDGLWLRQVLLYSDQIASIVPYGTEENHRHLDILRDRGVYTPLGTGRFHLRS